MISQNTNKMNSFNLFFFTVLVVCVWYCQATEISECTEKNTEFSTCGSACNTCDHLVNQNMACPAVCLVGCACKQGYVRDSSGNCVLPEECPCSRRNQVYQGCASPCDTCQAYLSGQTMCIAMCKVGCSCTKGYLEDVNGDCVLPRDCRNSY